MTCSEGELIGMIETGEIWYIYICNEAPEVDRVGERAV